MSDQFLSHDWFTRPIPPNVEIGERSWLYSSFAFLHFRSTQRLGLRVGHDTGIYNGTFFDLGPLGILEIGNYCSIVGAIFVTNGCVKIDDYAFLAHEVLIADSPFATPFEATHSSLPNRSGNPSEDRIEIGENVWVGARAIILRGAKIGAGSIIGAAAVVDFEVPPYSVVAGNPANIVRRLSPHPKT